VRAKEDRVERIAAVCARAERGMIVAGAASGYGPELVALAQATGFVLLAESSSEARFTGKALAQRCDSFPHILHALTRNQSLAKSLAPDLILQFGCEPASSALHTWLAETSSSILRFRATRPMTKSPGQSELVPGDPKDLCERIANATLRADAADSPFLHAWRNADEDAWAEVAKHLDEDSKGVPEALSEARAMATIFENLPDGSQLTLGNSMPIRSADMVLPGHRKDLRILHQRGASGIDGLIAGAIGSSGEATSTLLIGDVSCSHDIASLALAPLARGPLALLVIDKQGGQIFSHLPIAKSSLARDSQELWRTPPTLDFELACRAFGVAYRRVDCLPNLREAMTWSQEQDACCFVHLLVSDSSMLKFVEQMRRHCLLEEKSA
jgi:2-succinyl-5-enolpyruvyl-6-hydroxy-3-cyclohexene-1-carboxylate synthase